MFSSLIDIGTHHCELSQLYFHRKTLYGCYLLSNCNTWGPLCFFQMYHFYLHKLRADLTRQPRSLLRLSSELQFKVDFKLHLNLWFSLTGLRLKTKAMSDSTQQEIKYAESPDKYWAMFSNIKTNRERKSSQVPEPLPAESEMTVSIAPRPEIKVWCYDSRLQRETGWHTERERVFMCVW